MLNIATVCCWSCRVSRKFIASAPNATNVTAAASTVARAAPAIAARRCSAPSSTNGSITPAEAFTATATITAPAAVALRPPSTAATALIMMSAIRVSLCAPATSKTSSAGLRPTKIAAATGSWPRALAMRHTIAITPRLAAVHSSLNAQNPPAMPSGTTA